MSAMESSGTATQGIWKPIELRPHELRTAMLCNGYLPIPLRGKAAFLNCWQNMTINQTVIDGWADLFFNTGMRTSFAPVFDVDILDETASAVVGAIVERELGRAGKIMVRVGRAPKRG